MTFHQVAVEWHQAAERMKTTWAKLLAKLRRFRTKARLARVSPAPAAAMIPVEPAEVPWPK